MSATAIYINEYDLARLGFRLTTPEGWQDGLSVRDRTTNLPKRAGSTILTPDAEFRERRIQVTGLVRAVTNAALLTALDELKHRLYQGTIEVRFADKTDRFVLARCEAQARIPTAPELTTTKTRVSFTLNCPDPTIYDTQGSVVGFSSVKQPVALGTMVSAPIIRIMGAATNPTLTYRDKAGNSKQTMGFTVTLAATDYIEINSETNTIKKFASGVESDGINLWTSGDWIQFDPHDADYPNSVWPTIEVDAGTGEALYRKAWL